MQCGVVKPEPPGGDYCYLNLEPLNKLFKLMNSLINHSNENESLKKITDNISRNFLFLKTSEILIKKNIDFSHFYSVADSTTLKSTVSLLPRSYCRLHNCIDTKENFAMRLSPQKQTHIRKYLLRQINKQSIWVKITKKKQGTIRLVREPEFFSIFITFHLSF